MNLKIKSISFQKSHHSLHLSLTCLFMLLCWLQASAQDVVLESRVVQAGQEIEYTALRFIYSDPASPFTVDHGGTVILNAGQRIELHSGFRAEAGALLYALVDNLSQGDIDKEEGTYVFPNPTPGVFTIHSSQIMDVVRLLDVNGNIVEEKNDINSVDFAMDITKYEVGYYVLEVVSGKVTEQIRIQKE
jgi:hypothetical protein